MKIPGRESYVSPLIHILKVPQAFRVQYCSTIVYKKWISFRLWFSANISKQNVWEKGLVSCKSSSNQREYSSMHIHRTYSLWVHCLVTFKYIIKDSTSLWEPLKRAFVTTPVISYNNHRDEQSNTGVHNLFPIYFIPYWKPNVSCKFSAKATVEKDGNGVKVNLEVSKSKILCT